MIRITMIIMMMTGENPEEFLGTLNYIRGVSDKKSRDA